MFHVTVETTLLPWRKPVCDQYDSYQISISNSHDIKRTNQLQTNFRTSDHMKLSAVTHDLQVSELCHENRLKVIRK